MSKTATALFIFSLFLCASASAAANAWTGAGDGESWSDAANWDGGLPAAGADVVIAASAAATVTLDASTPELNSLSLSNTDKTLLTTLCSSNWTTAIRATNVVVGAYGRITCAGPFSNDEMSNRVWIVTKSLDVQANGAIDVSGKGYRGALLGAIPQGPGSIGISNFPCGAAHGGYGGRYNSDSSNTRVRRLPDPYDNPCAPVMPGSGAGSTSATKAGGDGGGVILVEADNGTVTLNGKLVANGGTLVANSGFAGGSGSGGSVYVKCRSISGSGSISAIGPDRAGTGGGGGGGCIAVVYDPAEQAKLAQPSLTFNTMCGAYWNYTRNFQNNVRCGYVGTVYFPDAALLKETINVDGQIYLGTRKWSPSSLTNISHFVAFPQEGFELDVAGDVVISTKNTSSAAGRLDVGGSQLVQYPSCFFATVLDEGRRRFPVAAPTTFHVGGDLKLGNGTTLCDFVYSAAKLTAEDADSTIPKGGTIRVDGKVEISSGCWFSMVSHPVTGVSPALSCREFELKSGGYFNASRMGYIGGYYSAVTFGIEGQPSNATGCGPGAQPVTVAPTGNKGASHGGLAAGVVDVNYLYDDENIPHMPGSGASGGIIGYGEAGQFGGGVAYILVDKQATVSGTIEADSNRKAANHNGGGAGGSIYLEAKTLKIASTGLFSARGGSKANLGTAGGGGRIAIWRNRDAADSTVTDYTTLTNSYATAAGGDANAGAGTIVFGVTPPKGLILLFR